MNKIINFKLIKKLLLEIWAAYLQIFFEKDDDIKLNKYSKYDIDYYDVRNEYEFLLFIVISAIIALLLVFILVNIISMIPFFSNIVHLIWIIPTGIFLKAIWKGYKNFSSEIVDKDENQ